jgi:uncharacterized protein (DUF1919 family)
MAVQLQLNTIKRSMLDCCNWMENTCYRGLVFVLDIDFDSGHTTLYGHPNDTSRFRNELQSYLDIVQEREEYKYA